MGIILIYLTFFGFLVLENNLEIFCVLEFRSFLLAFLYLKSSTKENFNALSYLFRFSCFLGLAYLGNALRGLVNIRMYNFLIRISIRVFIFFSKLPMYFLHHWLPKAHVEVVTYGSAILARLMLKFGMPFLAGYWDEMFFGLAVGFFALFIIMNTSDFKVFVAYSSIIHMTVFCLGLRLLSTFIFDFYMVPHTLLSARIFWFYREVYGKKGVRLYPFFRSYLARRMVLLWLGLPFFVSFLAEALIFSYLFYDVLLCLRWFLVFVFYVWVSLKFLRGSLLYTEKEVFSPKNFLLFFGIFCLFWLV